MIFVEAPSRGDVVEGLMPTYYWLENNNNNKNKKTGLEFYVESGSGYRYSIECTHKK